jgi:parallel beta-helix repeat protein
MKKLFLAVFVVPAALFAQGPLTPPGAPAPTMKTLQQVEPRTPISSLPFTINQSGSYYLTTNLAGISGQSGIIVAAHNVSIDLFGFELAGVPGAASGIVVSGVRTNLAVRHGTIRAWPAFGVNAGSSYASQLENLRVLHNNSSGLSVGDASTVLNCTLTANAGHGILGATNIIVKNCIATRNTGNGIQVDDNSLITECVSSQNRSNGVDAAVGCTVTENTANHNLQNGIVANARCRVFGNTANHNGAYTVSGAGFYFLGDDNHVEGNNAVHNYFGYAFDGDFNLIIKNRASDYIGGGFSLDQANNREAPIVMDPTGADPWANIAY